MVIWKWTKAFLGFALMASCNSENAPDCFQKAGDLVKQEVVLEDFDKILVLENVALVLKQGLEQKVEVETGENLYDDIEIEVVEGRLRVRDANSCNYVRQYGLTTVYVTSPNISEIRSSTGQAIMSDGVLAYPSLRLLCESYTNPEWDTTDGSFDLELDCTSVSVTVNGIAYFKLSGYTEDFKVIIAAGDSRVEAGDLEAQAVTLDHRGTNTLFVHPVATLSGVIRGTGDVISTNRPDEVAVEEIYQGRLIFSE